MTFSTAIFQTVVPRHQERMPVKAPAQQHTTPTYTTAVIRAMNIHLVHLTTSTASLTERGPARRIHVQSKVCRL